MSPVLRAWSRAAVVVAAVGGHGWTGLGWAVVAAWTVAFVALARWAYRRDTQRV